MAIRGTRRPLPSPRRGSLGLLGKAEQGPCVRQGRIQPDQALVLTPARHCPWMMDLMEPSEPSEVVRALWNRIQDRDWVGVGELVAEHAVIDWPASRERITGRGNFVAVNREYPEGWSIHVLRVVAEDDQVVSDVEVPHSGLGTFRVGVVLDGHGKLDRTRHGVLDDAGSRRSATMAGAPRRARLPS